MKKFYIVFISLILFLIFVPTSFAHSGCCSWHGGVQANGCGCNDGTPLSSTCAPYYTCTVPADNTSTSTTTNTYTAPAYIAPTSTPIPPTPTPTPTATPMPTNTPTPKPTPTVVPTKYPTEIPTIIPTTAVLGATTKTDTSNIWVGLIALLVLLGLFIVFCFGLYKLGRFLFRKIKNRFFKTGE